jgi:pullulanase
MEQKHTAQNIDTYDLFGTNSVKGVTKALQISESKIIVYIDDTFTVDSVVIYRISYEPENDSKVFKKKKLQGFSAEHKKNRVILVGDFDLAYNYQIKINKNAMPVILNPEPGGILDTLFAPPEDEVLGAEIGDEETVFKVWSPPALHIKLLLFDKDAESLISDTFELKKKQNGLHELRLKPEDAGLDSLEGCYYQYRVFAYKREYTALDPYAKSMAPFDPKKDQTGKAAIIKTQSFKNRDAYRNSQHIQNTTDVIAYEMHVRDFSSEPGFVNEKIAGCYSAITEHADYFKSLGVSHLQLMPVHKCHSQKDTDKRFSEDKSETDNYNWGYDPLNYFSLEGRYAKEPEKPEARIKEFQQMADALHQNNTGLILDVVFNHVFSAETFENIAPGCYLRFNEDNQISVKTGAGPSLESRHAAVRKLIIDVLIYYVKVLGADGFRFDLMEFTDAETLAKVREKVGLAYNEKDKNDLLLWGEAWDFKDIDYLESFTKLHRPQGLNIGMFNDVMRDSALGHVIESGFFQGRAETLPRLASAVAGGIKTYDADNFPFARTDFFHPYHLFADTPGECLNFVSIHDGLTLWDKINLTVKDTDGRKRLRIAKQALTALFTAQGSIIIQGGTEMLRTKPVSKSEKKNPRAVSSVLVNEEESDHFHDNSYQSPDYTNMLRHSRLSNSYAPLANSMLEYLKDLTELRLNVPAFRMAKPEEINRSLQFLFNHNEEIPEDCYPIHSFKSHKLKELHIEFINGPTNDILFLTGEIHPHEPNPEKRPLPVKFDKKGNALVSFSRKDIDKFDLNKWQAYQMLNIKLVKTPGEWDIPKEFYSSSGSNALSPCDIDEDFHIKVDLSVKDYTSEVKTRELKNTYLAYKIINQNPREDNSAASADCYFVVHNVSEENLMFKHPDLQKYNSHTVYADALQSKAEGLKYDPERSEETGFTNIKPEGDQIHLPAHSSIIIGSSK